MRGDVMRETPAARALDRSCDAILDASSDRASPARFAGRLVTEPRLAAAVDLHRDVEASLRRTMVMPDLTGLLARVEAAAAELRESSRDSAQGMIRWAAAASALLLMFLAMCATAFVGPTGASTDRPSVRAWSSSLVHAVGLGIFTASAVVVHGVSLRRNHAGRTILHRFGAQVALPDGARVLRVDPVAVVDDGCTVLLQGAAGPVALVVARKGSDPRPARLVPNRHRRCFRREFERVVAYELTDAPGPEFLSGCEELVSSSLSSSRWSVASLG